jgi:hypothetical protein
MGLSDITGVLSRYFVVGFFLPAYIALIALWLTASSGFLPSTLERHGEGTELLILGGVALVAALALSGFNYPLTRLVEGYPLERLAQRPVLGIVVKPPLALQRRSYDRLRDVADGRDSSPDERAHANWRLDQRFPPDRDDLLPTSLGNAIRAFEQHSNTRWGLDGITIWPRIESLLGADERDLHVNAKIDLNVFFNAAVSAVVVGICLVIDKAVHTPGSTAYWPLYAIPFMAAYVLYRASVDPAIRWGDYVRASIDLHRLEMYERLGVRAPTSFTDEREMATPINQLFLYGRPHLSDDLWLAAGSEEAKTDSSDLRLWTRLTKAISKGGCDD